MDKDRQNLQAIFDAVNVGLLLVDAGGAVTRINDTVTKWLGMDQSASLGSQPGDVVRCVHALSSPAGCGHTAHCAMCPIRNAFETVLRTGKSVHDVETQATLDLPEGRMDLWLDVSADPLYLAGRLHVLLSMNNITARKVAEECLRASRRQLEQANEYLAQTARELARSNEDLQQFAYVASHDLQEPLRMVNGFLKLLDERYKGQLDDQARQYVNFAVEGTTRMSHLVRDLLEYSGVDRRGKKLEPTNAELALQGALANLRGAIQEAGAAVTNEPLPTIRSDATQLMQLLQNLIGNAVKFRREDCPCKTHVGAKRDGDNWIFSVSDNGIGMEPQHLDRIFVIFQRLHTRDKYSGTGIGLAICKKIVERHSGRIWVESTPGQGSTFYFTLPA